MSIERDGRNMYYSPFRESHRVFYDEFVGLNVSDVWGEVDGVGVDDDAPADAFGVARFAPPAGSFRRLISRPMPLSVRDWHCAIGLRFPTAMGHVNTVATLGLRSGVAADEFFFKASGGSTAWSTSSAGTLVSLSESYPTASYQFVELRCLGGVITFWIDKRQVAGGAAAQVFTSAPTLKLDVTRDAGDAVNCVMLVDFVKFYVRRYA